MIWHWRTEDGLGRITPAIVDETRQYRKSGPRAVDLDCEPQNPESGKRAP